MLAPLAPDLALLRRMLTAMHGRGADASDAWRSDQVALALCRFEWELAEAFGGPAEVLREGELAVVADASLYYRGDLARALAARGVEVRGQSAAHLILAAYRAWGAGCAERLEGDFAFILWDGTRELFLCARDFAGSRPLYYAEASGTLLVGSTVSAILAHPHCPRELNLAALAEAATGQLTWSHETCYRAIEVVPAGFTLVRRRGSAAELVRHWQPPAVSDEGEDPPFEEAAEELLETLTRAVAERLDPQRPTSIWLSGGWDSTAVFGAAEKLLRERGTGEHLHAVSVSYPPGDPGREDELIEQVVGQWGSPVRWLDIGDIPLLESAAERAGQRDEPYAHPFERWNRALARGSRSVGSRVAFIGKGGDELFAVSDIFLADLLRRGRLLKLALEWRARPRGGWRGFIRKAVHPVLPPKLLASWASLRGAPPPRRFMERHIAEWIEPSFSRAHRLAERQTAESLRRGGGSLASAEMIWLLTHPFFPRTLAQVCGIALAEGVEVRSPLYDRRLVELAASRPRWERASGWETKLLLRRSMRGLLPDEVLAPRSHRTGVTSGYLYREMRDVWPALFLQVFEEPLLADLGIVDPQLLRSAWDDYLYAGKKERAAELFATLQTELWLRAREKILPQQREWLMESPVPVSGSKMGGQNGRSAAGRVTR
ncbi:MAG TPA: asparagine synthase-related protein [Longimicrobiaceae bacterium]|nr:asparagine synthase-related protein [Longimicrobiaceae bacterium]